MIRARWEYLCFAFLAMLPTISVATAAVLLSVPVLLVAPMIIGTSWVTSRVIARRGDRDIVALDAEAARSRKRIEERLN